MTSIQSIRINQSAKSHTHNILDKEDPIKNHSTLIPAQTYLRLRMGGPKDYQYAIPKLQDVVGGGPLINNNRLGDPLVSASNALYG